MKTKIKDIFITDEDRYVVLVSPNDSVEKAIKKMVKSKTGAVMIQADNAPIGIFTERDYMKSIILRGLSAKKTKIDKVMTRKMALIKTTDTVEKGLAVMNKEKCSHLPVCEDSKLYGLVSMKDLVNVIIKDQRATIEYLNEYISQNY